MRRGLRILAALAAAYGLLVLLLLPPRPKVSVAVSGAEAATLKAPALARGAYHIHTERSDGTGTVEDVAAAAARAGLQFIILTDHGDGLRPPLLPRRHHGVLVLDGVEISTSGGHYVALGLPPGVPTPYRLAGEPRDVVEDVRRMGGFGIAAHPDSPKPTLQWSGWDAKFDAIEWLNADTEWRDESRASLLGSVAVYPWRPAETVAALISHHPRPLLSRWDELMKTRRVVGLAAADAHARIGMRDGPDPYRGRVLAKIPSYEASFRAFALNVELPAPLNKDDTGPGASHDATAILDAIRAGHVYTTLDALATPAAPAGALGFEATSGGRRARMGDYLPSNGEGADGVEWRAAVAAPEGSTLRLMCDGKIAAEGPASAVLRHHHDGNAAPYACRLEAGWNDGERRVTWLVTNPIQLRIDEDPRQWQRSTIPDDYSMAQDRPVQWSIEKDPRSTASWRKLPPRFDVHRPQYDDDPVELSYHLQGGEREGQYVALVSRQLTALRQSNFLSFDAVADAPMRLSVQFRRPLDKPGEGERWVRSVFIPTDLGTRVVIWFDDMRPISPAQAAHPPLDQVHAVLFVVDTVNTPPGASGRVTIRDLRFDHRARR